MRAALITGITGQTGSYLAELLLGKGYRVHGMVRRTSRPHEDNLSSVLHHPSLRLLHGDVTDAGSVARCVLDTFMGVDELERLEVYNLAAMSFVKASFEEPAHSAQATYVGCVNVLEALRLYCRPFGDRVRFYQASSSEMFGKAYSLQEYDGGDGYLRHFVADGSSPVLADAFQSESTPFLPCSPYAVAKLAAHHLTRLYREAYGLHASCGILFNHEGPRRGPEFVTRKISLYVAAHCRAKEKGEALGPLRLGNLDAGRDWGFAGDYAEAMWLMLQQDRPADYVVATGEARTVREFLAAAEGAAGLAPGEIPLEVDESLKRPSEVPYLRGDASKARASLGWEPKTPFADLVRMMVEADLAAA